MIKCHRIHKSENKHKLLFDNGVPIIDNVVMPITPT